MNLQRMNELLQSRGWDEGWTEGWGFFDGITHDYEGWEIAVCDTDDATIHIYHPELDTYWSLDRLGRSNELLDFAEKTIRDVTVAYHQSPGQLSLNLAI